MNSRKMEFEVAKLIYLSFPVLMKIAKEIYLRISNLYLKFFVVFFFTNYLFLRFILSYKVEKSIQINDNLH